MTEPIVRTEPLGGSPLARAAIDGQLSAWYVARPTSPSEWTARVRSVQADGSPGGQGWLDALRPALAPSGRAADRLERVVQAGGVVVTTGQQPGLFGGPIYTWAKALSALTLADELEAATGIPTAPVFWAASDDADYAEASWTAVAVPGGAERLSLPPAAPLGRPMSEMPLGDPSAAIEALVRASGATADERPLLVVRQAYRADATVGGAYLSLLRTLLEPFGVAVLDAAHESVAACARPYLERALERAGVVAEALRNRDAEIRAHGFTPQVAEVPGLSLVFARAGAGAEKRRVPVSAGRAPANSVLSPNVLLRPVIERALLPTVSYVAGPGEISYFAQVGAVASALEMEAPMVVPRWSTTILEPHVIRILERLGVSREELADPHAAEGRLARAAVPGELDRALTELRSQLDARFDRVAEATRESGLPLPSDVVRGAQRGVRHRLERLERRVVAAVKRREADTMRQIGTARGALYPLGIRQERALNFIPILARHGSVVMDRMRDAAAAHARSLVVGHRAGDAPSERSARQDPSAVRL